MLTCTCQLRDQTTRSGAMVTTAALATLRNRVGRIRVRVGHGLADQRLDEDTGADTPADLIGRCHDAVERSRADETGVSWSQRAPPSFRMPLFPCHRKESHAPSHNDVAPRPVWSRTPPPAGESVVNTALAPVA